MELNKAKQQIKEADTAISSQKSEIEKLNHIINEADQERIRQKKEYDIVVNERDILGTQVGHAVGHRGQGSTRWVAQGRLQSANTCPKRCARSATDWPARSSSAATTSWLCCTRRSRSSRARSARGRYSTGTGSTRSACSRSSSTTSSASCTSSRAAWPTLTCSSARCTSWAASCCRSAPRSRRSARSWRTRSTCTGGASSRAATPARTR